MNPILSVDPLIQRFRPARGLDVPESADCRLGIIVCRQTREDLITSIQSCALLMKVLLVDDDRLALLLLGEGMLAAGLEVVQAESGHAALAVLERDTAFDVIISDIQMPQMDGLTLAGLLRQKQAADPAGQLARTPLLALTGSISSRADETNLLSVFDAVISKPVSIDTLLDRLRALIPTAVCAQV